MVKTFAAVAVTVGVLLAAAAFAPSAPAAPAPTFEHCVYHSITASHPPGWPCPPFLHRNKTLAWLRDLLTYNGYHSYRFQFLSSRHIRLYAVLDGAPYYGDVVKLGPRKVGLSINETATGSFDSVGQKMRIPFDP